jgi:hypothetical protein
MAERVTLSVDDDLMAELKRRAQERGCPLQEVIHEVLQTAVCPAKRSFTPKPFVVRSRALYARPGVDLDDIESLLEQAEGPLHR